eukprot:UN21430
MIVKFCLNFRSQAKSFRHNFIFCGLLEGTKTLTRICLIKRLDIRWLTKKCNAIPSPLIFGPIVTMNIEQMQNLFDPRRTPISSTLRRLCLHQNRNEKFGTFSKKLYSHFESILQIILKFFRRHYPLKKCTSFFPKRTFHFFIFLIMVVSPKLKEYL